MKYSGPIRAHEYSIKTNPKPTLIADSIILFIVLGSLVAINVLVIVNWGFNPLLLLVWLLLGGIGAWLIISIIKCSKYLKKMKEKKL